jgi:hypothetical protein
MEEINRRMIKEGKNGGRKEIEKQMNTHIIDIKVK